MTRGISEANAIARVPHDWPSGTPHRRRTAGGSSARALLFTVLGEFVRPDGRAWTSSFVRALGALGVEEKSARQALARTALHGWLRRERSGRRVRWELTEAARTLLDAGAERIYGFGGAQEDWDGRWVLLLVDEDATADLRERLATRLAWAGFGSPRRGMWMAAHPEREAEARTVLGDLGLLEGATSFVARSGEIGDEGRLIAQAWDLDALERRYEAFVADMSVASPQSGEESFVALTRLVHEWRIFPFLDPGLPSRLLPEPWMGDEAMKLFRERRAAWGEAAAAWFHEQ